MAKRNPRPTDIPNWIPDDVSGIVTPSGSKQNTGWLTTEKPPAQFFNWFWNRLTQIIDYVLPRADKYNIIIDTDVDEGDYDTLTAYLADAPVSGDRVFIKVDETLTVQTIIPAGITLHQLAGKKFSCATNIATSIFQFGDDVVIEGPFILETTQAGVTAIAFELNGDNNYLENLVLDNSGVGTITNAVKINVNKESNYTRGYTDNTGAGAITNVLVDSSTVITNDVIIRDTGDKLYRSSGANTLTGSTLSGVIITNSSNFNGTGLTKNSHEIAELGTIVDLTDGFLRVINAAGVLIGTVINLGAMTVGDILLVSASADITKGVTSGDTILEINATGTGVVKSGDNNVLFAMRDNILANNNHVWPMVYILKVTTAGTISLQLKGTSIGSDSTIPIDGSSITVIPLKRQ